MLVATDVSPSLNIAVTLGGSAVSFVSASISVFVDKVDAPVTGKARASQIGVVRGILLLDMLATAANVMAEVSSGYGNINTFNTNIKSGSELTSGC